MEYQAKTSQIGNFAREKKKVICNLNFGTYIYNNPPVNKLITTTKMKVIALLTLVSYTVAAPAIVTIWQTSTTLVPIPSGGIPSAAPVAASVVAPLAAPVAASPSTATAASVDVSSLDSLLSSNFNKLLAFFGIGSSLSAAATVPSTTLTVIPTTAAAAVPVSSYVFKALASSATVATQPSAAVPVVASSSAAAPVASGVSSSDVYAQIYSSKGVDTAFAKNILDAHNKYRAIHQVGPLTWDIDTFNYAQNNANNYDCSGILTHTHGPFGENLAAGFSTGSSAVDAWYDEGSTYSYTSANTYDHFTQVVWKGSTKVGCAWKDCTAENWGHYVVCEYSPAGNFIGQNLANVFPPTS